MSSIYYYGNQAMLKSGNTPCATPIDKVTADHIKELEARIDNASNIYHEKVHIWPLVAAAQMIDALRPQPPEVDDDR